MYYSAYWNTNEGIRKTKTFGVLKYGKEEAFRLACEYRAKMIQELKDSGEWYDDNHGI